MPHLTQADFLQTPCPASANASAASSSFFSNIVDEDLEIHDYGRVRSSIDAQPRRPSPPIAQPKWDEILRPKPRPATIGRRSTQGPIRRPPPVPTRVEAPKPSTTMPPPARPLKKRQANKLEVYVPPAQEDAPRSRTSMEPKRAPLRAGRAPEHAEAHALRRNIASGKENQAVAGRRAGGKAILGERKDVNMKARPVAAKGLKESNLQVSVKPQQISRKRSSGQLEKLRLVKRTRRDGDESIISNSSTVSAAEDESFVLPAEVPLPQPTFNRVINLRNSFSPAMYESWWLSAQESSISQLLNALFKQHTPDRTKYDPLGLRQDMLQIYSSPPFPLLHRRLQASLHVGALAPTKDVLARSSVNPLTSLHGGKNGKGWGEDVALCQNFLDLFIENYEIDLLATALEVVIGREMYAPGENKRLSRRERKKVVETYVIRFIVACEDALMMPPSQNVARGVVKRGASDDDDWGTAGWVWRRSVLRSLMLILLLDKSKSEGIISSCLFQSGSTHKTSTSVIQQLARLLLPSLGDITRPLTHMGYTLKAGQNPLDEFSYPIENIAIDLRDGVRLVRVVELLLYPNCNPETRSWPLSSHVKFPALSRAQKLYNVSLALRALDQVGANKGGVTAADIVDGYRERTVGLLLEIMQRWGLGCLVDWDELKREIRRLEKLAGKGRASDDLEDINPDQEYAEERLLTRWAGCIAESRSIRMDDMTSCFSDGKIFNAIIEEYEDFFPKKLVRGEGLDSKLAALGCNSYFASLFGKHIKNGLVFDKEFVISALAFFSSRLVAFSARQRAAMVIQNAFRRHKFRQDCHKRINLLLLAHDCAEIVQRKQKIVNAAITIQRAYRKHLKKVLDQFIHSVTAIQCASRRYLAERKFKELKGMTLVVQRTWRQIRDERFYQRMGVAKEAFTGLQAAIRGHLQRERYLQLKEAVQIVEENWLRVCPGLVARREFLEKKNAVAVISTAWSNFVATQDDRARFREASASIVAAQAIIRGAMVRQRFVQELYSTYVAQSQIHTYLGRQHFLKTRAAAITIQRRTRAVLPIIRAHRATASIVRLQALWRGYITRKNAPARLRILRGRIEKASKGETLGDKIRRGAALLKQGGAHANRGLMAVESAMVLKQCVDLARSEGVVGSLLPLIANARGTTPGRQVLLGVKILEKVGVSGDISAARKACEALKTRSGKEWKEVREKIEGLMKK